MALVVLLLLGAAALSGCFSEPTGGFVLYVKDAPRDEFAEVHVAFEGVRLHRAGSAPGGNGTDADDGTWIQLAPRQDEIDLLDFTQEDARALLANATLDPGHYDQILIAVGGARGVLQDGGGEVTFEVTRPELRITRGFNTTDGKTTTVLIDIDLDRSIVKQGNGAYRLNPVVGRVVVDEDAERLQRSVADRGTPQARGSDPP